MDSVINWWRNSMFKKLCNKLILINLGITTLIIVIVFTMIYLIFTRSAENRPPKMPQDNFNSEVDSEWEKIVQSSIREEKEIAARELLITLIVSGIAIEIVVVLISYFMAEEAIKPVKESYEAQKIFIANASHEIKTPLAAISANLEAADIKNNKWISNIEIETDKLARLNTELLTLARTDLNHKITSSEVDLGKKINKILDGFEPRLKTKKLIRKIDSSLKAKVNLDDFEQILSILIDNAIKYSDSKIIVTLNDHRLKVENDGEKIPSDKIKYIFDRFYQVDKNTDGVGLGLSIAKSLADRNNYKISAKSDNLVSFELIF